MADAEEADRPERAQPWLRDAADVARSLGSDPAAGLTDAEAQNRLQEFGPNQLDAEKPQPAWRKFLAQFQSPLIFLLVAAAGISFLAWFIDDEGGLPFDVIVIAAIILANGLLGFFQEARAEQAVAALQRMAAATSTVLRDGATEIPTVDVVPGDILLLSEGQSIPADARLIEAASLRVSEASLTGESQSVLKEPVTLRGEVALADRSNMVFGGTAVVAGRGRAVVTATGMRSEIGRIAGLLGRTEKEQTPLQREVAFIGRTLTIAVVVITIVVVGSILLTSKVSSARELVDVLLVGVSLAVAAVPEGLPAVLSVVLALGVQRMAKQRAIVKRLSSVETLGSASVICSDKTGTLTQNEMTVQAVVTPVGTVTVTGTGYRPEGEFLVDGAELPPDPDPLRKAVVAVLHAGALANDAELRHVDSDWQIRGDPTEAALLVAEAKLGTAAEREERFRRLAEVPFTSERKLMTTLQADAQREGEVIAVTKGAPGVVVERCTHERVGDEVRPLDEDRRRQLLDSIEELAGEALRPLAIAYRPLEMPTDPAPGESPEALESVEHDLIYLGAVGIMDPPRPEAAEAIRMARRAGIRVMMITGDHPQTALRIARDLGLAADGDRVLTGNDLERMDDAALREAVREGSVYARVAPEHKLRIVDALQDQQNVVAMTGDGVNDAPALRAADIGVAMGITGTDVTREAADMVLADDNFATIVAAVREGRAIFANIRTFLRFLLSSNAGEVLTMFLGVVGASLLGLDDAGDAVAVPLLATQILWINLLTDAAPALALGVDPPPDDVMAHPPRRLTDRIVDAEMLRGIALVGLVMAAATLFALDLRLPGGIVGDSGSIEEARTMAFTTLVLAQLYNCVNARSDRTSAFHHMFTNRLLWLAIAASVVLQVCVVHVPFLNDAFGTEPLSLADWAICVALASAVLWVDELRKLLLRRISPSPA